MDEDVVIEVRLDDREINRQIDRLERKLKTSLNAALGGGTGGNGTDRVTRTLRDQEAAALRLAQAQARLASTGGDLSKAQNILSTALDRTTKETVAQVNAQTQLVRVNQQMQGSVKQSATSVTSLGSAFSALRGGFVAFAALRVASFFTDIAQRAVEAAVSIDKQVNSLRALTGSAAAAERRFAQLVAIAQKTPGLTTSLALTLDTQLRILNASESTINRLLPAIGRLNAISPLGDPQRFAGNLAQLVTQNFEKQDLKELVGNSPFAGQLIKQIFDVSNPTNAKAIRESAQRLGITTVDRFFTEFAKAAENNPQLQAVQESLGTQFEKLQDRINIALAPIGNEIARVIIPAFKDLVSILEREMPKVTNLLRDNREELQLLGLSLANSADQAARLVRSLLGIDQNQGILRTFLPLIVGATNPSFLPSLEAGFKAADQIRARRARQNARLPFGLQFEDVLADVRAANVTATNPNKDRGGLGGGGASRARDPRLFPALSADDLVTSQFEGMGALFPRRNITPDQMRRVPGVALGNPGAITGSPTITFQSDIDADAANASRNRIDLADQRLRVQEVQIQNQVNRGLLTEADAQKQLNIVRRTARDELIATLQVERENVGVGSLKGLQITEEIERLRNLGVELSLTERFMRGFGSATDAVGDAFERFGRNVSSALTNTRDLLNGLKNSVLQLFNDLLGRSLQNVIGQALGPLVGLLGNRGGVGGGIGGGIGNIFRTPSTFPVNLSQLFTTGSNLTAPASLSSAISSFGPIGFGVGFGTGGGAASAGAGGVHEALHASILGTAKPGFFSSLGQSIGAAAPFLGLSLGSSLGGQSITGQIAGAAGGFLGGGAIGSVLGGITGKAAAFFTNPFTIAIGAGLLVGSFFLGKAKQRKQDEEASGQFLRQALDGIEQLRTGIITDQVEGAAARGIFDSQILNPFRQQISGLKTKSVVESRLKNQVRDLENQYQSRIEPVIADQQKRVGDRQRFAAFDARLIPQFAIGGMSSGGLAILHPNEMVLTQRHQSAIRARAGEDIFESVGVPGVQSKPVFDNGGIMPSGSSGPTVVIEKVVFYHGMSQSGAEELVQVGLNSRNGQNIITRTLEAIALRKRGGKA